MSTRKMLFISFSQINLLTVTYLSLPNRSEIFLDPFRANMCKVVYLGSPSTIITDYDLSPYNV